MIKKIKKNPEIQEIYGFHSVNSALQNPERKHFNIYLTEKYKDFVKKYSNIIENINILTNKEMLKLYGNESVTQGIVLKSSTLIKKDFDNNEYFVRISYIIIGIDIPPQELEFALLPSR